MADVITEATIRFVAEGAGDTEAAVSKARGQIRAAGEDARGTSDDFDTWLGKISDLSAGLGDDLQEKYGRLFEATDKIHSITGAATGAFELAQLAVEGLGWAYEAITGEQAAAAEAAAAYNRQLALQAERAAAAAAAISGLESATAGSALDVREKQTIAWVKATRDLELATEGYNAALGERVALEQQQAGTIVTEKLMQNGVKFVSDLEQAERKVEGLTLQWNRLDERARRAMTGALNQAVSHRDAIYDQRDAMDAQVESAKRRVEQARLTLDEIRDTATNERDLDDIANEVLLTQMAQEDQQGKVTAAIRASTTAAVDFAATMDALASSGPFARLLGSDPAADIEAVVARHAQEDADSFEAALNRMLETEGFVAEQMSDEWQRLARDMDKSFAEVNKATKEADENFRAFGAGLAEGAAGAIVDVALLDASLEEKLNSFLRTASTEASVQTLLELGHGFKDLAFGLPTASVHFASAGYFGAVAAVAGVGAAATGGLAESSGTPAGPAASSPTSPGSFRRGDSGDTQLGETVINVNLVAGRRPATRRESRDFADETRRAFRTAA